MKKRAKDLKVVSKIPPPEILNERAQLAPSRIRELVSTPTPLFRNDLVTQIIDKFDLYRYGPRAAAMGTALFEIGLSLRIIIPAADDPTKFEIGDT